MRVRLSRNAADFLRNEAAYLRQYSRAAAERFVERARSVRTDLAKHALAGFSEGGPPVPGLRRLLRDGYRYDYFISDDGIEIADISHSRNTPLADPDDDLDFDFEA